jgi:hypothetical protein
MTNCPGIYLIHPGNCGGKICWHYLVILLTRTPIVKKYRARLVFKNGQQKDISYNEIGLRAQNTSFILGSVLTQLGGPL